MDAATHGFLKTSSSFFAQAHYYLITSTFSLDSSFLFTSQGQQCFPNYSIAFAKVG